MSTDHRPIYRTVMLLVSFDPDSRMSKPPNRGSARSARPLPCRRKKLTAGCVTDIDGRWMDARI
jgi:hypothetical protein